MNIIPISAGAKDDGYYRPSRHGAMKLTPTKPPSPPKCLSKKAKTKWREIARLLFDAGIAGVFDGDTLSNYCETWVILEDAHAAIAKAGMVYQADGGLLKINPAINIAHQASMRLLSLGGALGLSPLARKRLRIELGTDRPKGVASRDRQKGPPPPSSTKGNDHV